MITQEIFRHASAVAPPGYPYAKAIFEFGNINMLNRPSVKNSDGSISTVRSMSFGIEQNLGAFGKHILQVLVPTVHDGGYIMTDKQATELYYKTGKHLGKFLTVKDVNNYAKRLHLKEEARINGREYKEDINSPAQTAIYDAITSFKVNYGLSAGAELSIDLVDHEGEMFLNNYFQIGEQYKYRGDSYQMAAVEVSQGEGRYWKVNLKLRTWAQQQMKEDFYPQNLKSANGYDFARKLAAKFGLGFVGEEVKGKQQAIKVKTKNNKESAWDVLQKAASDNQYYAFIADGNLFFCSPLFLLGQWGIDEVVGVKKKSVRYVPLVYPTPDRENRFLLMSLPQMRSSFDSPKEAEGSAQLYRENAEQLRAGMTVMIQGMGIYNEAYIVSSVDISEGEPEPVNISFATVAKLAPEDKKKVEEKIAETTVVG